MGQSHGKGHAFIFETGVLAGAHQIVMAQSAECFLYLQKTAPALPTECENGYFLYFFNTINKGTDPEYALIDSTTIPVHQNVSGAKGIHCHKPSGTWRSDTACDAKWLLKKPDKRVAAAVFPPKPNRKHQQACDLDAYKRRYLFEDYVALRTLVTALTPSK